MAELQSKELHLTLPFSTLTEIVGQLSPEDMWMLREWLDEKLAEYEDELMLRNPRIMAEIREAQAEYEAGNYVSLEELEMEMDLGEDSDV